jgi:hypothetical protein
MLETMSQRTDRLAYYLVRSRISKKLSNPLSKVLKLIQEYAPVSDLCQVYWNEDQAKIRVSNGDWAGYDTEALYQRLEDLLGEGNVEMEAEIGPPARDGQWRILDVETGKLKPLK